ncbi:MAG: restriction endonuclease subunit S [Sedimentisphaerales bacterium]|nr:restriction endonuclease subunit S [Sedimentisphaerales bacterium]
MNCWKKTTLGKVAEITSSKRIFAEEYLTEGVPFYRGKEIIEKHNGNDVSTELFISHKKYNEIRDKFSVPQAGEILLTSVGTLGIPYIVKDDEKFYFKDGNLTWFKNFDGIENSYLYYWLISDLGKEEAMPARQVNWSKLISVIMKKLFRFQLSRVWKLLTWKSFDFI